MAFARLHRFAGLLVTGLLACQSAPVRAQDASATETQGDDAPALWEFRLAAFGRYAPVYPGAEDSELTLLPLPIPVYRGSFLKFGESLDQVARGDIAQTQRLRVGIDFDFSFGEDSADIPVREGMPDLDFMFAVGPELEVKLDNRMPEQGEFFMALQLRASVSLDGLDPSSRGYLLNPQFEYRRDRAFGGDNLLSLRWTPTWASEDFMDYYYEVAPGFATAGRPAYDATTGYLGSRFTVALTRRINDRLFVSMSASYFYNDGAKNETSPLFRDSTAASLQAAFVWKLAETKRRAKREPAEP